VAGDAKAAELATKLRAGNYGWGHAKQDLLAAMESELGPMRERYQSLRADEKGLDKILDSGAERARKIARATLERVRDVIGIAAKQ
jgi:tryptophanyl-tRNA synthetase